MEERLANTFRIKKMRTDVLGKNRQHVDRRAMDFTKIIFSKITGKPYLLCELPVKSIDYRFEYRIVKDSHGFLYVIDEKVLNKAFDVSDETMTTRDPAKKELELELQKLKAELDEHE